MAAVVGFLFLAYATGLFDCSDDTEEAEPEREDVNTHIGYDTIDVCYSFRGHRVRYRHFLPNSSLARQYSCRLLLDGHRDGNIERPAVSIWVDHEGNVHHFKINDNYHSCITTEEIIESSMPDNHTLCGDAQRIFNEWQDRLDIENEISKALRTPAIDLVPHYLPPELEDRD